MESEFKEEARLNCMCGKLVCLGFYWRDRTDIGMLPAREAMLIHDEGGVCQWFDSDSSSDKRDYIKQLKSFVSSEAI